MEQLNIVGKRSGEGIVTHRATMVNVLSRGVADRLTVMDFTIGRKGLLNYIRSLAGSNIVKIVPDGNGSASGERTDGKQRLKVVCGAFQSYLDDEAWINDKTGHSFAEVRFMPDNTLTPNIGSNELADAIAKVLPFTASDDSRPVLKCVMFEAVDGKLRLVGADGFMLGECTLDYEAANGEAVRVLVDRADLKPMPSALRKAKRVKVRIGKAGDTLDGTALFIDTDVAKYTFTGMSGQYPEYDRVIPSEFACLVHLDTQEALKAVRSLKATAENPKEYSVDLAIAEGNMTMTNTDDRGEVVVKADSNSESFVRLNGDLLATTLRAFGGMVDFSLAKPYEAVLFSSNGFRAVVMPMMSQKANEQQRADAGETEAEQPESEQAEQPESEQAEQPESEQAEQPESELEAEVEATLEAMEAESEQAEQPRRRGGRGRGRNRKAVAVA